MSQYLFYTVEADEDGGSMGLMIGFGNGPNSGVAYGQMIRSMDDGPGKTAVKNIDVNAVRVEGEVLTQEDIRQGSV